MSKINYLLPLIFILFSCNPSKNEEIDQTGMSFQTDDSSKLYFKNVRQNYYDVETMEEAKLEVYRLKKRSTQEEEPIINLSIVNNWRYDEAYILLEPNQKAGSLNQLRLSFSNKDGEFGQIIFDGGNKQQHLEFASKIYEQLLKEAQFKLILDTDKLDILNDTKSREAFRITMFDYYRLVRSL
ncbi:MAG TPA: hypothetical protein VIN11_04950 [Roseivirga sp.]